MNWRDRWQDTDKHGCKIVDIWLDEHDVPLAYRGVSKGSGSIFLKGNVSCLVKRKERRPVAFKDVVTLLEQGKVVRCIDVGTRFRITNGKLEEWDETDGEWISGLLHLDEIKSQWEESP